MGKLWQSSCRSHFGLLDPNQCNVAAKELMRNFPIFVFNNLTIEKFLHSCICLARQRHAGCVHFFSGDVMSCLSLWGCSSALTTNWLLAPAVDTVCFFILSIITSWYSQLRWGPRVQKCASAAIYCKNDILWKLISLDYILV